MTVPDLKLIYIILATTGDRRSSLLLLRPGDNGNLDPIIPEDIKMSHTKTWEAAYPELISVTFIDGSMLQKKEAGWSAYRRS